VIETVKRPKKHNRRVTCNDKLSLKREREKRARSHASTSTVVACHFTTYDSIIGIHCYKFRHTTQHSRTILFFFFLFFPKYVWVIAAPFG